MLIAKMEFACKAIIFLVKASFMKKNNGFARDLFVLTLQWGNNTIVVVILLSKTRENRGIL